MGRADAHIAIYDTGLTKQQGDAKVSGNRLSNACLAFSFGEEVAKNPREGCDVERNISAREQ